MLGVHCSCTSCFVFLRFFDFDKMALKDWVRAVWVVDDTEEEGAMPSYWIQEGCVCWPPKSLKLKAHSKVFEINERWEQFPLKKIKVSG